MPFNMVNIFLLPIFMLVKTHETLKRMNRAVLKVTFTPVALFSVTAFVVVNIILLPIAFSKALLHKMLIFARTRKPRHL